MPTNDVFEIGWMVAKSDTDLDLNEEFFAIRKRNLSNEERLAQIRSLDRGRSIRQHMRGEQTPLSGTLTPPMTTEEWGDFAEVEQPRPAPPQEAEDESAGPPPLRVLHEGVVIEVPIDDPRPSMAEEAAVEIEEVDPEPVEEAAGDDALEEAPQKPNPELVAQARIPMGNSEKVVAEIPKALETATEVEPESFVESPVNTTEQVIEAGERTLPKYITPSTSKSDVERMHGLADGGDEAALKLFRENKADLIDAHGYEEDHVFFDRPAIKKFQTVVENPFANPFYDTSAFSIREDRPRGFVNPVPSPPIEEIQKEEKPPELNGFQTKKEDDLSLLPSSMLIKDNSIGDDLSLLPTGWKHD